MEVDVLNHSASQDNVHTSFSSNKFFLSSFTKNQNK